MSTTPEPEIVPLFATPIVRLDLPDAAQLTADLRRVIEEREKVQETTHHSNYGGWQSTWDMDRWGGAPAIKLMAHARNLANRVTMDRKGGTKGAGPHPGYFAVTWHGNMWANINRTGHANEFHSHPGAYWSCVYYVDDGGIGEDPSLGGELEFMDPRGALPAMNAPHLAVDMPGGLAAGVTERFTPKVGRLVMFPSWLYHQVRPYFGNRTRISIAMNLSL